MKRLAVALLLASVAGWTGRYAAAQAAASSQDVQTGVLSAAQTQTLFPPAVYFSGQTATVQMRNSAAVRWSHGKQTMFGIVDASGYSSGIKERYQFYVLTDVPIEIDGKHLAPGAYGAGFLSNEGFEVMDLGGNELFHAPVRHDEALKRPRPLIVTTDPNGNYRLYLGRDYVQFSQSR
jgi:hypothetical protein